MLVVGGGGVGRGKSQLSLIPIDVGFDDVPCRTRLHEFDGVNHPGGRLVTLFERDDRYYCGAVVIGIDRWHSDAMQTVQTYSVVLHMLRVGK